MGSTYYSLHYHWVCSTKDRRPLIRNEWRARLFEYLGGTVRGLGGVALRIGGVEDHVHALIGLTPIHRIADFTRELKKASSIQAGQSWEPHFKWQDGYAVFAVSTSMMERVRGYIDRQTEHHRKRSFTEELKDLLERHGVAYDPKYLL